MIHWMSRSGLSGFSVNCALLLRRCGGAARGRRVEFLNHERADIERLVEHEGEARSRADDEPDLVLRRDRPHDGLETLLELRLALLALRLEVLLLVLEPPLRVGPLALDVPLQPDLGILGENLRVEL